MSRTLAEVAALLGVPCDPSTAHVVVSTVGIDSRTLAPGALWVACRGERTHAAAHEAPGASAVLTDDEGAALLAGGGLPVLVVDDPRQSAGIVASWLLDDPSASLTVIGVTGTNGKTTVTHLIEAAVEGMGRRAGIIGTLGARIDGIPVPLDRTTPEAPEVLALLARMREADVDVVAMEVSSHALVLGRVQGVAFEVGVFTNLSRDHLDFHADMEDYFAAKARLFEPGRCRLAVVCIDDAWGRRLAAGLRGVVPMITYGRADTADVRVRIDRLTPSGMHLSLDYEGRAHRGETRLVGEFNAVNIAGAFAALVATGIDPRAAFDHVVAAPGVPGRMERIDADGTGRMPTVVVDYAHTPDAVRIVLEAVERGEGRLITVLGCGGDRDREKRPLMGAVAAEMSDVVIVTDDNPRSEDPAAIRSAILVGALDVAMPRAEVVEVADRRAAIERAVLVADPGDVVMILGKGAEQGQEAGGTVLPFDDRSIAREVLATRMSS